MPRAVRLPLDERRARELRAGDEVLVSGRLVTGRDAALRVLLRGDDRRVHALTEGSLVYHCAPVVKQDPRTRSWRFAAAGPTLSLRQEPYQGDVIARYGLRGVLGKGGMGERTLAALRQHGAVYLHAPDEPAVMLARRVTRVLAVYELDQLGSAEAIWSIEVRDFPAVVTMDSHGESLHAPARCDVAAGDGATA